MANEPDNKNENKKTAPKIGLTGRAQSKREPDKNFSLLVKKFQTLRKSIKS